MVNFCDFAGLDSYSFRCNKSLIIPIQCSVCYLWLEGKHWRSQNSCLQLLVGCIFQENSWRQEDSSSTPSPKATRHFITKKDLTRGRDSSVLRFPENWLCNFPSNNQSLVSTIEGKKTQKNPGGTYKLYALCFEFIPQYSIGHTQIPAGKCVTTLTMIRLLVHPMLCRKGDVGGLTAGTSSTPAPWNVHAAQNCPWLPKHPLRFSKASVRSHSHCLSSCIACHSHVWNGKIKQSDVTSQHYKTIHHYQQMQIWGAWQERPAWSLFLKIKNIHWKTPPP